MPNIHRLQEGIDTLLQEDMQTWHPSTLALVMDAFHSKALWPITNKIYAGDEVSLDKYFTRMLQILLQFYYLNAQKS